MSSPDIEPLLRHADWVRSLAHSLVADPALADDVAQEAWLAALRRPPARDGDPRPWLARVMNNAAHSMARSRGARREREEGVAKGEAAPSADELVAEVELQRALAARVLELREPYRGVLILRYFHGLSPRAIAARRGVPVATVKTHLQRGLAELRERLDDSPGGREGWLPAVAALARPSSPVPVVPAIPLGWMLTMKLEVAVLASLVAVAAAVILLVRSEGESVEPGRDVAVDRADAELVAGAAETAAAPPLGERVVVAAPQSATPAEAPVVPRPVVRGLLVGVDGAPLPGRRLRWFGPHAVRWAGDNGRELRRGSTRVPVPHELEAGIRASATFFDAHPRPEEFRWTLTGDVPHELVTRTDAAGRFEYAVPSDQLGGSLELEESDYAFLGAGWSGGEGGARELVLVGCPTLELGGVVVDPGGTPLAGVLVIVEASFESVTEFPLVLDRHSAPGETQALRRGEDVWASTDREGRFHYPDVPDLPGGRLLFLAGGYENLAVPLPAHSDLALQFVLTPEAVVDWGRVAGRVLDEELQPVEGAEVSWSGYNAFTDADGSFGFDLRKRVDDEAPLLAVKRGHQPAFVLDFAQRVAASRAGHEDLVLVLGPAPLALAGRVIDAAGVPREGWCVALQDPTPKWELSAEEASAGVRQPIVSDADGSFEIPGLSARSYRLRAWDPQTHLVLVTEPYDAGASGVEIVVPVDAYHARVSGRVVGFDGAPIEAASVSITYRGVMVNRVGSYLRSEPVATDSEGRFELANVPRSGVAVEVRSESIEDQATPIEELAPLDDVVLRVRRLARFRVELDPADPADAFAILDAGEARLPVTVFLPEFEFPAFYPEFVPRSQDGGFPVSEVSDAGVALVVLKGREELRRIDLHLDSGEVQVVRP